MALPPELYALRDRISKVEASKRTDSQNQLMKELSVIDEITKYQVLEENFRTETKITSSGGGICGCCGQPI